MRRPTVWSMMHRIRAALADDSRLLAGLVEMDEAYVGGKPRRTNRKDDSDPKPRGRGTSKTPVVGAVERGGRTVRRWESGERDIPGPVTVIVRALMDSRAVRRHFGLSIAGSD